MPSRKRFREVIFFKDYFEKFFVLQDKKVKARIIWTLELIEGIERVPETYLIHISSTKGLYEIRIKSGRINLRIFCFFDRNQLVILANAFQKKTGKTPKAQIKLALRIKKEYEDERKAYSDS